LEASVPTIRLEVPKVFQVPFLVRHYVSEPLVVSTPEILMVRVPVVVIASVVSKEMPAPADNVIEVTPDEVT